MNNLRKSHSDTCEIPLSQGMVALIDQADRSLVAPWPWHAVVKDRANGPPLIYARCSTTRGGARIRFYMHQIILPVAPGLLVDHVNTNGLDNRRSNLRAVTPSQSAWNTPHTAVSITGHRGVKFDSRTKTLGRPYSAAIKNNGQRMELGSYRTAAEASEAYARAAEILRGHYAIANLPV